MFAANRYRPSATAPAAAPARSRTPRTRRGPPVWRAPTWRRRRPSPLAIAPFFRVHPAAQAIPTASNATRPVSHPNLANCPHRANCPGLEPLPTSSRISTNSAACTQSSSWGPPLHGQRNDRRLFRNGVYLHCERSATSECHAEPLFGGFLQRSPQTLSAHIRMGPCSIEMPRCRKEPRPGDCGSPRERCYCVAAGAGTTTVGAQALGPAGGRRKLRVKSIL